MPLYEYVCTQKHKFDRYLPVSSYDTPQICSCGAKARRIISLPQVFIKPDINYQSPIDGRPITSMRARLEDLARNDCIPYDPEQKTDYRRRVKESEESLERKIDEAVDKEISTMPSRKRERLEAELQGGMTAEPLRTTPKVKPIKVDLDD